VSIARLRFAARDILGAGKGGAKRDDQPVVTERQRRDLLLPAFQRAERLEFRDVPGMLVLEQHLVNEVGRAEDQLGQDEGLAAMPAEPVDTAVAQIGRPGLEVFGQAVARRPRGTEPEPEGEQLGAHLIAAPGQQAGGHGPLVHHAVGIGDPQEDAPILAIDRAVQPDDLEQRADPGQGGRTVGRGFLEVDPGRSDAAVLHLEVALDNDEGRLTADDAERRRADPRLTLALLSPSPEPHDLLGELLETDA
jgi:hypothetical protein